MKEIRLILIFIFGLLAFFLAFSYVAEIEEGVEGAWWMLLASVASGFVCWLLTRTWDLRRKLPRDVMDRKNDRA